MSTQPKGLDYGIAYLADVAFRWFSTFRAFVDEVLMAYRQQYSKLAGVREPTSVESHLRHLYPAGGFPPWGFSE